MIDHACAEATSWPANLKIAVNLSPVQIRTPRLPLSIASALSKSGLSANRLELEVTESILLDNDNGSTNNLNLLRDLGTHLVMDDFGTGYSSLTFLRTFPFDKVKIDRSFVVDLARKRRRSRHYQGGFQASRFSWYGDDRRGHRDRAAIGDS